MLLTLGPNNPRILTGDFHGNVRKDPPIVSGQLETCSKRQFTHQVCWFYLIPATFRGVFY